MTKPYEKASISHVSSPFQALEQYRDMAHEGTDFWFDGCYGTPLLAPEDCVVEKIVTPNKLYSSDDPEYLKKLNNGYGILLRAKGYRHLYWHCMGIFPVFEGENAPRGKIVAFLGNSGQVYRDGKFVPLSIRHEKPYMGAHLHYELWDMSGKKLDVAKYIDWLTPVKMKPLDVLTSVKVILLKMLALLKK